MTVTILYTGPVEDAVRVGCEIARQFTPDNSYIDTKPFVEGYNNGTKDVYGKSVYATNVDGFGEGKGLAPIHSAPINFAYLERAVVTAAEAKANNKTDAGVTVTIADAEKLYWEQLAKNVTDMGFTITIAEATTPSTDK